MRIPSGKTDQLIYFVAVDSTDLKTRETGLTGFTVYRSRNGGAATAYTTPTVTELSAANMPGVYALTIDEDTTIAGTSDSEEYCVHITQAAMAPVTRTIELYRRDVTSGTTMTVAAGVGEARVVSMANDTLTAAAIASAAIDADSIASNAITAAKIATDAVDADALAADALAEIKTQVVSALSTDTYAEPTQGAPAATTTLAAKINYLYKAWRNKKTQTSTDWKLFADDTTTVDQKATVSDDGTTTTVGEVTTGP